MNCNESLEKHTYRFHMLHLYIQQNNRDMFHPQYDSDLPDSFEDTVRNSPLQRILLFGNLLNKTVYIDFCTISNGHFKD